MSRAPGLPHQLVLQKLQVVLGNYLESNPIGLLVPGAGAVFGEYDAVIPDLVFVRHDRWDKIVANERFVGAPDLVIEVLSPGKENHERDLLVKRQLYAKYGVTEYWIIDTENRSVWIFRLQGQTLEEVATLSENDEVASPLLPGFHLNIGTVFKL